MSVRYLPSPPVLKREVFTTSGTWVKPAFASWVRVVCASGGSAGTGSNTAAGESRTYGAGGAAGGRSEATFNAEDLPDRVALVVGIGGAATPGPGGQAGGVSRFGDLMGAGSAGPFGSSGTSPDAGDGGRGAGSGGRASTASGGTAGESQPGRPCGTAPGGAVPGGNGISRSGTGLCGSGGAAGASGSSSGGNGGIPGGGGGAADNATARPGDGGRGEVIVTTYF